MVEKIDEELTSELRFAVVLYGGVSLAIYMNGIAQELLRMARGGSGLPRDKLNEGEQIYRDLACALGKKGGRARFVIDIISGSSAGGINGVALAKALALGCEDIADLRRAWTQGGDIDKLLNDRFTLSMRLPRKESLLSPAYMFQVLHDAIHGMAAPADAQPLQQQVDLFITATDLHGRDVPIELTSGRVQERVHKEVFHFVHDQAAGRTDFDGTNDVMLAFAARCTSSFPVAFPPMRYEDIPANLRGEKPPDPRFYASGDADRARLFADGGYLDNRPFSYAIDTIPFRPTTLPGERKLIFVDPFPEAPPPDGQPRPRPPIDFVGNAVLAAYSLPKYETIRDDIRSILQGNRRLERLRALQDRTRKDRARIPFKTVAKPPNLTERDLAALMDPPNPEDAYPECYPMYHHLRVYSTTDTLAAIVARMAGVDPQSDGGTYLREVLRIWRDENFVTYFVDEQGNRSDKASENLFLSRYDIEFRLRRLNDLRTAIDDALDDRGRAAEQVQTHGSAENLMELRRAVEAQLAQLRRLAYPDPGNSGTLIGQGEFDQIKAHVEQAFRNAQSLPTLAKRQASAEAVYRNRVLRPLIDGAMDKIGAALQQGFDDSSRAMDRALFGSGFRDRYNEFHWHDVLTLPYLDGTGLEEYTHMGVFRISPADSALNRDPGKLAGIRVAAFGGFFSQDWREHDILWGRLDAVEGIVTALMPEADAAARQEWIDKLQARILVEEFADEAGRNRRLALLRRRLSEKRIPPAENAQLIREAMDLATPPPMDRTRFAGEYGGFRPLGPQTREIIGWSTRAMSILSQMIDDLPARQGTLSFLRPRTAAALRTGSVFVSRLVLFAMPGSYLKSAAEKVLLLVALAGLLMAALAPFFSKLSATVGLSILLGAVLFWSLLHVVGRWLRGSSTARNALIWFGILLAVVMMLLGLYWAGTVAMSVMRRLASWIESFR